MLNCVKLRGKVMPELPEVETVCAGLRQHIIGREFAGVDVRRRDLRCQVPAEIEERLLGKKVVAVNRRAKYILIELKSSDVLVVHLGMSGKLLFLESADYLPAKHDHLLFYFQDDTLLVFNDPRRFGIVDMVPAAGLMQSDYFAHLGNEPLEHGFTGASLFAALQRKKVAIKQAIMDQQVVVGVGNIYASEALFLSHIHPLTSACELSLQRCVSLVEAIKDVLQDAIGSGGSTLRDYRRLAGDVGGFQHRFRVYDRAGQPCVRCNAPIQRIVQGGRSTYFCFPCQQKDHQEAAA